MTLAVWRNWQRSPFLHICVVGDMCTGCDGPVELNRAPLPCCYPRPLPQDTGVPRPPVCHHVQGGMMAESQLLRLLVLGRGVDALLRQLGCTVTSCGRSRHPSRDARLLKCPDQRWEPTVCRRSGLNVCRSSDAERYYPRLTASPPGSVTVSS